MSNPTPPSTITTSLTTELLTRHHLPVLPTWVTSFLNSTRQPLPPLPALTSTAHFRLLNSDFTQSLSPNNPAHLLPPDIANVQLKERRLASTIPVQVLDVEDIGASKWSQIEAIERVERGEEVRGREVIRTLPVVVEGDEGSTTTAGAVGSGGGTSNGPQKLLLQDAKGTKVTAFEMGKMRKLGIGDAGMAIGMKVLLKQGTLVRRGMVMLSPENVIILGGKVEIWDKGWREERKARLIRDVQQGNEEAGVEG